MYPVIKIDYTQIQSTDFKVSEPTVFQIEWNGVNFDFLISYKGSEKVVLWGSGHIPKDKISLPAFLRHSWHKDISYSGIWYADPTLYLYNVELAWYYGTNKRWFLKDIAEILQLILQRLEIKVENSICFGSSGGGYSSIVLATMLHSKATVINPQCNISNYKKSVLKKFSEAILHENEEFLMERANIVNVIKNYNYFPRIHYLQNITAVYDLENQLIPFLKELSDSNIYCSDKLIVDFYSAKGRHVGMPSKEKCLEYIEEDFNAVVEERPLYFYDAYINGIGITLKSKLENHTLEFEVVLEEKVDNYRFAFYLLDEKNNALQKLYYTPSNKCNFTITEPGRYRIKYYIDDGTKRESYLVKLFEVK